METFALKGEYIQLNQLLKALAWVDNGAEANNVIDNGMVKVNGVVEPRRRNKIRQDFKVEFNGRTVIIK